MTEREYCKLWSIAAPAILAQDAAGRVDVSWWVWHWHPDLYCGLLLLAGGYLLLTGPLRGRITGPESRGPSGWQVASFQTGVLILFFSLAGPLHELSDNYLFSAHMAQHMLITLVAPPLLLLGTPGWLIEPIAGTGVALRIGRTLTFPPLAFLLFTGMFAVWHFPVFYDGALQTHYAHILEHLLFLATAVIAWWPILSPSPSLPPMAYPAQLLYLVLMSISQTPLFAVITFSNHTLYPFYEAAPRVIDLSPLADQQLGGIIMKVSWLVVFVPAICVVFLRWFHREETEGLSELRPTLR